MRAAADIEDMRVNGNSQFFEGFDHVATKAIFVGERRTGVENASVDLVIEMLEESADDHRAVFNCVGCQDCPRFCWRIYGTDGGTDAPNSDQGEDTAAL